MLGRENVKFEAQKGHSSREHSLKGRVLTAALDTVGALLSVMGAWWIWTGLLNREFLWWHLVVLGLLGLVWTIGLAKSPALNGRLYRSFLDDLPLVLSIVLLSAMVISMGAMLAGRDPNHAGLIVVASALGAVVIPAGRGFSYILLNKYRSRARRRVLIIGAGRVGHRVARLISGKSRRPVEVVGFLDKDPLNRQQDGDGFPVLGSSYDLEKIIQQYSIDEVIIAFSTAPHHRVLEMIWECDRHGVNISVVPRFFESVTVQSSVENIKGVPVMHLNRVRLKGINALIKRGFDIAVSGVLLLLLWPLLLVLALVVKLDSPGPVIFSQRRVGSDGRTFTIYKFRSMRTDAETLNTWTRPQDPRRTRTGRLLRGLNLDELPQLFNVLKGDMSLVGPRPEQPVYVQLFEESIYRYAHRHRVKSGITGWAQVNGLRGDTSIEERVLFDNYYIENWSLWLDIKIIILTLFKTWLPEPERGNGIAKLQLKSVPDDTE